MNRKLLNRLLVWSAADLILCLCFTSPTRLDAAQSGSPSYDSNVSFDSSYNRYVVTITSIATTSLECFIEYTGTTANNRLQNGKRFAVLQPVTIAKPTQIYKSLFGAYRRFSATVSCNPKT